ncbi:hypothetical protein TUM17384_34350 [Shewanella algae]|nr:hypothetical protein TUM17384_34350 [Shewanella algae]
MATGQAAVTYFVNSDWTLRFPPGMEYLQIIVTLFTLSSYKKMPEIKV